MSRTADAPIAPSIVEQASEWLMLQWGDELTAEQHQAFSRWQAADSEHQRAWQRLQQLQQTLGGVPAHSARAVLQDIPDRRRREALKLLGLVLIAGGSGYLVQGSQPWRETFAQQRSRTGEIRHLTLSDGTRLALNSASAVDVLFSATERRIRLVGGEIMVDSGHDTTRPLIVETRRGDVQALGTRFSVRDTGDGCRVDLYEGALEVRPLKASAVRLNAGERLWFADAQVSPVQAADNNAAAWTDGKLIAERQPLGEFLTELARHRSGVLRCDPVVSGLRLTGVFPLKDTDAILTAVQHALPVRVESVTRYWVTIKARV